MTFGSVDRRSIQLSYGRSGAEGSGRQGPRQGRRGGQAERRSSARRVPAAASPRRVRAAEKWRTSRAFTSSPPQCEQRSPALRSSREAALYEVAPQRVHRKACIEIVTGSGTASDHDVSHERGCPRDEERATSAFLLKLLRPAGADPPRRRAARRPRAARRRTAGRGRTCARARPGRAPRPPRSRRARRSGGPGR